MKKKILSLAILFTGVYTANAQNVLKIQAGATLSVTGGAIVTLNNIDLDNDGTLNLAPGDGTFNFTGNAPSVISGSSMPVFDVLQINKTATNLLSLNRNISVAGAVNFISSNIDLNGNNILLQPAASFTGESEASHIMSSGTGFVEITQPLSNPSSANPGNLGAIITSSQNLGNTVVRRNHNAATIGANQSILRRYEINPVNNAALNATLRFHYLDAELNGLTETSLDLWRSPDNATWTETGQDDRNTTTNYVEKNNINDFSFWTLSSPAGGLPVVFSEVNVRCDNGNILVSWKTEQESGSDRFEVERSTDGRNWTLAGTVSASGNSSIVKTYSFTDVNPISSGGYYRVAEHDLNGSVQYTSVLRSSCNTKDGIQLWPNPAVDAAWLTINLAAPANVKVSMYDSKGSLISTRIASLFGGSNQLEIPVKRLAGGVYHVRVEWGGNTIQTFKLIKK